MLPNWARIASVPCTEPDYSLRHILSRVGSRIQHAIPSLGRPSRRRSELSTVEASTPCGTGGVAAHLERLRVDHILVDTVRGEEGHGLLEVPVNEHDVSSCVERGGEPRRTRLSTPIIVIE